MTEIKLIIVDDKDAEQILKSLESKSEILWHGDSMKATMTVDAKKKEIKIFKGAVNFTRIRL